MEARPSQIRLLKMWHGENYQLRVCPKAFKGKPAMSSHYPREYKACKQECKDLNPVLTHAIIAHCGPLLKQRH